jgi:hypothetical protein
LGEEHRLRVFENRVLSKIFGPKRNEVTGEWRKLHKEDLREQYNSRSIIRVNKSRRMRWAGHVEREWERRGAYKVLVEGKRQTDNLEISGADGKLILSWFFRKWDRGRGLD